MENVFHIEGWEWENLRLVYSIWTVKDPSTKRWIVKYTGSFYSYREWVFSRLASHLGLNAEKVILAHISKLDLKQTGHESMIHFSYFLVCNDTQRHLAIQIVRFQYGKISSRGKRHLRKIGVH